MRRFTWVPVAAFALALAALAAYGFLKPGQAEAAAQEGEAMAISPAAHRTVAVDAGHGLPDGGCVGVNGTSEHVLNLQIAEKVRDLLEGLGANVVMTRTDEYALHPRDMPRGKRKQEDFAQRREIIERSGAEVVVSVHMNEYPNAKVSGAQAFFQEGDEQSRAFAQAIQCSLLDHCEGARASENSGDFFMLRLGIPGALVECGFLSNPREEALLKTEAHQRSLAIAIVRGIVAWFEEHPEVQGPVQKAG